MKTIKPVRILQTIFLAGIALLLLCSLSRTFLSPKEINLYENRKANQPPSFSLTDFLSSQFQDSLEAALSDQVIGAQTLKKGHNTFLSELSLSALSGLYATHPNQYFRYNQVYVFNSEYLLFAPRPLTEDVQSALDRKLNSITSVSQSHPELKYHVFYIEKDTDRNFETGESCGIYSYIASHSSPELYSLSCYAIDNFQEFSKNFYRTDHHWNHVGSYSAYLQLCQDMGISDPMERGEEFLVAAHMEGSKIPLANNTTAFSEPMYAYRFSFPSMEIYVNGSRVSDYGQQNHTADAISATGSSMSYGQYYGSDMGEIIFSTGNTEKENILVIGESYDNAVLKLLATHFNKTHSIDLRYYEHYMERPFDFHSYVQEHNIDRVLFIGNIDYFILDEFNIGG